MFSILTAVTSAALLTVIVDGEEEFVRYVGYCSWSVYFKYVLVELSSFFRLIISLRCSFVLLTFDGCEASLLGHEQAFFSTSRLSP